MINKRRITNKKSSFVDIQSGGVIQQYDVIQVRIDKLPSYVKVHLSNLKEKEEMGNWVRNSILQQYTLENNPKAYLLDIIRNNYFLIRKLLRVVGSQGVNYGSKF